MKKIISLLLALVMVMGLAVGASAEETTGSITISNASKGETYSVYKLFSASVTGIEGGSIAYSGDIPSTLAEYFEKDSAGNISVKDDVEETVLFNALKTWTESATVTASKENTDGAAMVFTGLAYGYYVVVSTQDSGAAITVTSTNPNATIVDKNTTVISALNKNVDKETVSIGDTVTYTVSFNTANYQSKENEKGEVEYVKITEYTITDDLPEFLKNATVTNIIIDADGNGNTTNDQTSFTKQFADNAITIDWVDEQKNSLYANGAVITITYTATITEKATIAGEGNTNTVTLTWTGCEDELSDTATVYTYEFDLVKTEKPSDQSAPKTILSNAKFKLQTASTSGEGESAVTTYTDINLIKNGNVYRVALPGENGATTEIVAGNVTIQGLANGTYYLEETEAPAGYNKLTERKTVNISGTNLKAEVAEGKYVSGGVEVENSTGSALPSTGGIGTTLFYVIGGLLMAGAAVLLITKKRMT